MQEKITWHSCPLPTTIRSAPIQRMAAYETLWDEAGQPGLNIITGVELDVIHENRPYHLLAYGVDVHNQALGEACAYNTRVQEESNLSLLRCMERDGLGVSERDYHSYAIPQGRGGWKLLNYLLDEIL